MTNNEIITLLKQAVGYNYPTGILWNIISSLSKEDEKYMNDHYYLYTKDYYPRMRHKIEKCPWISIKDRLPEKEGRYLTLLDCNEHEIDVNTYENGKWIWCNSHVCYWMPIPEENDNEIDYEPSVMNWHDGGQY